MKAIVRPKFREHRALRQRFRRGSGHEKLTGVESVDDFPGVEGIELDAEVGVREFRPADDFLDALRERIFRLGANWAGLNREKEQNKHRETAERTACRVFQKSLLVESIRAPLMRCGGVWMQTQVFEPNIQNRTLLRIRQNTEAISPAANANVLIDAEKQVKRPCERLTDCTNGIPCAVLRQFLSRWPVSVGGDIVPRRRGGN